MTQAELEEKLAYWQRVLRLADWQITLATKRRWEMDREHHQGECSALRTKRRAEIRLLDPQDIGKEDIGDTPLEWLLIHELLHCYTCLLDLPEDGPRWVAMEQMVDGLAGAFYELAREAAKAREGRS